MPEPCRLLLAAAAVNEGGTLGETLQVATRILGTPVHLEVLDRAIVADLVRVDGVAVRFRHPLIRAAVWQATSFAARHDIHAALSDVVEGRDRRVYHAAMAALDRDEDVAAELDSAAERARSRGAPAAALRLTELAADLSVDPSLRVDRLLRAMELAVEVGRRDRADEIDDTLRSAPVIDRQRATLAWVRELREHRVVLDPAKVLELVEVARGCLRGGDDGLAGRLLRSAAVRCWWSTPDPAAGPAVAELAEALPEGSRSAVGLFVRIAVLADTEGDSVRAALVESRNSAEEPPGTVHLRGLTAQLAGSPVLAGRFFAHVEGLYRATGQLGLLAQTMVSHAAAEVFAGQFRAALVLTDEAVRLAADVSSHRWQAAVQMSSIAASACLNPDQPAGELPEHLLDELGNPAQWAQYAHTRALVALAGNRHQEAFAHLRAMHTPGNRCYHDTYRTWAVSDLVEAALLSGHLDEVSAILSGLAKIPCPSPMLRIGLAYGRAALATDDHPTYFERALHNDDVSSFPFLEARIRLVYGAWLRRHQAPIAARDHLRLARDAFEALGVVTWANRSRRELAAAGEASPPREPDRTDVLTPQELAIARLAAQGLSNREIGASLFLSHGTVGSHLYRIFPKLGLTSRVQLVEALRGGADRSA